MTNEEIRERNKDAREVLDEFHELPIPAKADLLRDIARTEWAYKLGFSNGLKAGQGTV